MSHPKRFAGGRKKGRFKKRSPTDRRLYSVREVKRILGVRTQEHVVIYARVSSAQQKTDGNLARQVQRLKQYAQDHGYEVSRVFQEQASGINENRKQLHQLLQLAEQHEIQRVLIECPNRVARFGYRYVERFFRSHGVTVEVTHKTEPKSSQEELVNDLLTIVTVFSARLYGKRSQKFRQKAKQLIHEMEGGKRMPMLVKTVKIGVHKELHAVKQQSILATQALYNQTMAFYMEFFVGHVAVLDAKKEARHKNGTPYERMWTNQELLAFAERHTLDTKTHPHPLQPLMESLPSARTMPVSLRRAAINHAIGKVKSWYSLLKLWEATDRKKRPPQLGTPHEPITFYSDMVEYPDVDLEFQRQGRHDFVAVKLFHEGQWQLVPLPVILHPHAQKVLGESQTESARIAETTSQITARKAPKEAWTKEEKASVRPKRWYTLSLSLYVKRDKQYRGGLRFALHIPFEKG